MDRKYWISLERRKGSLSVPFYLMIPAMKKTVKDSQPLKRQYFGAFFHSLYPLQLNILTNIHLYSIMHKNADVYAICKVSLLTKYI